MHRLSLGGAESALSSGSTRIRVSHRVAIRRIRGSGFASQALLAYRFPGCKQARLVALVDYELESRL